MKRPILVLLSVLCLWTAAVAQENDAIAVGLKPFGSYHGGDIDSVSLSNGKLQIDIPLLSYPQRGDKLKFSFVLQYNNRGYRCETVNDITRWSWKGAGVQVIKEQAMVISARTIRTQDWNGDPIIVHLNDVTSADGSSHHLAINVSEDETGILWTASPPSVIDRSGVRYTNNLVANDSNRVNTEDPSGNKITASIVAPIGWTDTLGRFLAGSIPSDASYGTLNRGTLMAGVPTTNLASCPSGTIKALLWNVPAPNGGTATIKFCYAAIPISVTGLCGSSNGASGTDNMMTAAVLPDGTSWRFGYSGLGDLASIVLPTGGAVSYVWEYKDPPTVSNRQRFVASRTVSDGANQSTWTYQCAVAENGAHYTVVTDPDANETTHRYGPFAGYVDEVRSFSGPRSNNVLLKTVTTMYTGVADNPDSQWSEHPYGPMYVLPVSITTTLQNGTVAKTDKAWDGIYGLLEEQHDYDYGQGGPGPLLRKTYNTYLALADSNYSSSANNLLDLVSSTKVCSPLLAGESGDCDTGNGLKQRAYTLFEYDRNESGSTIVAPAGSGVTTQHDPAPLNGNYRGNLTRSRHWLSSDGSYPYAFTAYYDTGMPVSSKDPAGHTTSYAYSATFKGAYPTQVTGPSTGGVAHVTSSNYDFNTGLATSATDENGQVTSFSYDNSFRLIQKSFPDGGQVNWAYTNAAPFKVTATSKITSTMNKVEEAEVDGLGRVKQTRLFEDGGAVVKVDTTYDVKGRVSTVSNPYRSGSDPTYGTTTTAYDDLDRVTSVTGPDGSATTTSYNDNCVTVTDAAGKARKSCSDGLGRLTNVWEDPAGANYETDYQYDGLGNLVRVDQKGGSANSADWRTRQFSYDSLSRLLTASNPESGTIGYSYDSDSNVVTKDSPQPNQASPSVRQYIDYCYDELHRLTAKFYRTSGSRTCGGSAAVSYAYDAGTYGKPHRSGMSDASGSTAWTYNNVGAITQEQRTIAGINKSIGYSYNLNGSLATLTYPSGRVVAYGYNAAAQPVSAIDTANSINFAKNATYAPQGALSSVLYGYATGFAGITARATFNNRLQPTLIEAQAPSQTVLSLSYSYGSAGQNNGNVFQIQNNRDTNRSQSFAYDALNRIQLAWSGGALWGEHFDIDPWGNLYKIRACQSGDACNGKPQGENLDTTADQANRLVGLTYDAAGNVTNDGVHGLVTFDAENRVVNVAGASYTYDGDGRRVKKDSGTLYWTGTGSDALAESDLGGVIQREFVFFGGKRIARLDGTGASPTVHYYFSDHLGSASVVTDAQGATIEEESDYYPYGGERVVANLLPDQNYKFTGKERDTESGFDYFGARYYASSMGRWLSPDWAAKATTVPYATFGDPQTLNLNGYVANRPLLHADTDGHCFEDACVLEGAAFVAAVKILTPVVIAAVALGTTYVAAKIYYSRSAPPPPASKEQGRDAQGKFVPKQPGQAQPGSGAEKAALKAEGATKTGTALPGTTRKVDGTVTATGQKVEVKSGASVNNTEQLVQAGQASVSATGQPLLVVTTNPNVKVSAPAQQNPNLQIRPVKNPQ